MSRRSTQKPSDGLLLAFTGHHGSKFTQAQVQTMRDSDTSGNAAGFSHETSFDQSGLNFPLEAPHMPVEYMHTLDPQYISKDPSRLDGGIHDHKPLLPRHHEYPQTQSGSGVPPRLDQINGPPLARKPQSGKRSSTGSVFRFCTQLMAPRAMVAQAGDDPATYLNKHRVYIVTIADTKPMTHESNVQYRTSISLSFDDECGDTEAVSRWQLFREGRGHSEASKRGSNNLRAVEWVRPERNADGSSSRFFTHWPCDESFDGFSIIWAPNASGDGSAQVSFQLRCNFLSTDFSLVKGVKGIPVRLNCRTEVVSQNSPLQVESSYCKIKTFRDHGAERKLNNDRVQVNANICRFKQKLARNRRGGGYDESPAMGPSSTKPRGNSRAAGSKEVGQTARQLKDHISMLGKKLASGRDSSQFYLTDSRDDETAMGSTNDSQTSDVPASEVPVLDPDSSASSSYSRSANSPAQDVRVTPQDWKRGSTATHQTVSGYTLNPFIAASRADTLSSFGPVGYEDGNSSIFSTGYYIEPTRIARVQEPEDKTDSMDWIEAMDVDVGYRAIAPASTHRMLCVHVKASISGTPLGDGYLRAVYLDKRDYQTFLSSVCTKHGIDPAAVVEVFYYETSGLYVEVEDATIESLREYQEISADFEVLNGSDHVFGNSWDAGEQYRLQLSFR